MESEANPLPDWLKGDPIAWLEQAYGSSNEIVLEQDKDTREWVRRNFPRDPHEPVK